MISLGNSDGLRPAWPGAAVHLCWSMICRRANYSKSPAAKREVETLEHNHETQLSEFPLEVTGKSLFQQILKQNKRLAEAVSKRPLPNSWKEIWHGKRGRKLQRCKTALAWQQECILTVTALKSNYFNTLFSLLRIL